MVQTAPTMRSGIRSLNRARILLREAMAYPGPPFVRGFTLIELLAAIAIIAMLASLLLPTIARAKSSGQSTRCLSNLKQLQLGYLSYVEDNQDRLPLNRARRFGLGDVRNVEGSWVLGNARHDTNTANLSAGTLYSYIGATGVYRCPSDRSTVLGSGGPRSRSYSIHGWLNAYYAANGFDFGPEFYPQAKFKLAEVIEPPPSGVFAFIDHHPDSIEAGVFVLEQNPSKAWPSMPADRHGRAANLSFLDGHVEHWPWRGPKVFRQFYALVRDEADLQDLRRLQAALPHNKTPKPSSKP